MLVMPDRKDAARPPVDPKLQALHDGWNMSITPEKNSMVMQRPVYDSAVDCVHPATVKAFEEKKQRLKEYNEMLDMRRAESHRYRILREAYLQRRNIKLRENVRDQEANRKMDLERQARKHHALIQEVQGAEEDCVAMVQKIRRESEALYNNTKQPFQLARRPSFARSLGCSTCGRLTCSARHPFECAPVL